VAVRKSLWRRGGAPQDRGASLWKNDTEFRTMMWSKLSRNTTITMNEGEVGEAVIGEYTLAKATALCSKKKGSDTHR
jgi:hypothetical protein